MAVDSATIPRRRSTAFSRVGACPLCEPPRPPSLRRNFAWTLAGNVVYVGCQCGILVILAKLGSPEMVGQFVLGLAIATPVVAFCSLQPRIVQATDADAEGTLGHYLALQLVTSVVALMAIAAVASAGGYRPEVVWVILLVGLARTLEVFSDVFFGFFQQRERMDRVAASMLVKGPLTLLLFGLGLYFFGGILGGLAGLLVARLATLGGIDLANAIRLARAEASLQRERLVSIRDAVSILWPRWDRSVLCALARRGLPLSATVLLLSLNTSIPRLFVERYLGERALGYYASMAYLMVAGTMVVTALGQAAAPRLARYHVERNHAAFRRLLLKMITINGCLGAILIAAAFFAGSTILTLCYRAEYAEHADVFVLLTIAAAVSFVASAFGQAATASRRIRLQPIAAGVLTLFALAASGCLIPTYGLFGAAWSTVVVAVATLAVYRLLVPLQGHIA